MQSSLEKSRNIGYPPNTFIQLLGVDGYNFVTLFQTPSWKNFETAEPGLSGDPMFMSEGFSRLPLAHIMWSNRDLTQTLKYASIDWQNVEGYDIEVNGGGGVRMLDSYSSVPSQLFALWDGNRLDFLSETIPEESTLETAEGRFDHMLSWCTVGTVLTARSRMRRSWRVLLEISVKQIADAYRAHISLYEKRALVG